MDEADGDRAITARGDGFGQGLKRRFVQRRQFLSLRADPAALPALMDVDLGSEGYAIVKVAKVLPRETLPPADQQRQLGQYTQTWAAAETVAYYNLLRERYKVKVNVPKPKELLME